MINERGSLFMFRFRWKVKCAKKKLDFCRVLHLPCWCGSHAGFFCERAGFLEFNFVKCPFFWNLFLWILRGMGRFLGIFLRFLNCLQSRGGGCRRDGIKEYYSSLKEASILPAPQVTAVSENRCNHEPLKDRADWKGSPIMKDPTKKKN